MNKIVSETITKRFPNQEANIIHREKVTVPFLYVKWESVEVAKANLKPIAFCLWLYLTRHADGMKWIFSMDQFCKWCGCSLPTGRKAKQELLNPELGYLVPVKGKKNDYDFYEYPEQLKQLMKEENETIVTIHKESGDSPEADGFKF